MVHSSQHCAVCMQFVRKENLLSLACQHQFCRSCWEQHCTVLVKDGVGVGELRVQLGPFLVDLHLFSAVLCAHCEHCKSDTYNLQHS